MSEPVIIGLTGSIGMGKTTTAGMFRAEGVPVWNADEAVHRLYSTSKEVISEIGALCPEAVASGSVDRGVLKQWIARDPGALARIEAVIHPRVAQDRDRFLATTDAPILLIDVPLLFESGLDRMPGMVTVVVSVPPEIQRARVLARPGMTEAQLDTILARQMPDHEKRARADHVIETETLEGARAQVRAVLRDIREKRNLA